MKTKIIINSEVFGEGRSLDEAFEYYKAYCKSSGFIFDRENQDVYKIYDKEFNVNKDELILINGCSYTIEAKFIDFENEMIIYHLDEE